MEEQLITFKTAELAKEKGFNLKTYTCYDDSNQELKSTYNLNNIGCEGGLLRIFHLANWI